MERICRYWTRHEPTLMKFKHTSERCEAKWDFLYRCGIALRATIIMEKCLKEKNEEKFLDAVWILISIWSLGTKIELFRNHFNCNLQPFVFNFPKDTESKNKTIPLFNYLILRIEGSVECRNKLLKIQLFMSELFEPQFIYADEKCSFKT